MRFREMSPRRRVWTTVALLLALVAAAALAARWLRPGKQPQLFLQTVPANTSALVYGDIAALRSSRFIDEVYRWAPHPEQDIDYKNFVQSTGFDYERDLDAVLIFLLKTKPPDSTTHSEANAAKPNSASDAAVPESRASLAIAEGRWDANRIAAYARRNGATQSAGGREIVRVQLKDPATTLYFAVVDRKRLALSTELGALSDLLAGRVENPEQHEWEGRVRRVAGSPVFAVLRQDSGAAQALARRAPGGFSSPQLSSLLEQLQWITIAAKPGAEELRVVSEGEALSASTTLQLSDLLKGIVVLGQTGLNDPRAREQLDPALRAAYLELLQGAEVTRIDRGRTKSVRLSVAITPKFLESARPVAPVPANPPAPPAGPPARKHSRKSAS